MFEGHDTTTAAIDWACFAIGTHPDVQKKLHEEIDRVFGELYFQIHFQQDKFSQYVLMVLYMVTIFAWRKKQAIAPRKCWYMRVKMNLQSTSKCQTSSVFGQFTSIRLIVMNNF